MYIKITMSHIPTLKFGTAHFRFKVGERKQEESIYLESMLFRALRQAKVMVTVVVSSKKKFTDSNATLVDFGDQFSNSTWKELAEVILRWFYYHVGLKGYTDYVCSLRGWAPYKLEQKALQVKYPTTEASNTNFRCCIICTERGEIRSAFYSPGSDPAYRQENSHSAMMKYLCRDGCFVDPYLHWCGFYTQITGNSEDILLFYGESTDYPHTTQSVEVLQWYLSVRKWQPWENFKKVLLLTKEGELITLKEPQKEDLK